MSVAFWVVGPALAWLVCVLVAALAKSPLRSPRERDCRVKAERALKALGPVASTVGPALASVDAARRAPVKVDLEVGVLVAEIPALERRPAPGAHRQTNGVRRVGGRPFGVFRRGRSPLPARSAGCALCGRPWVGHDTERCLRSATQERIDAETRRGWHWLHSFPGGVGTAEPCLCATGRDHDEIGRAGVAPYALSRGKS